MALIRPPKAKILIPPVAVAAAAVAVVLGLTGGEDAADDDRPIGRAALAERNPELAARGRPPAEEVADRPNVIVISTDDQDLGSFNRRVMPSTVELLKRGGTNFTDSIVTTPACCPSRASFLTGQYAHNHGVLNNTPGYSDLRRKRNILPAWLQRAGYWTGHIGKYLNHFTDAVRHPERSPAGWDEWRTEISPHFYYDYPLGINGEVVEFGNRDEDYLTRVLTDQALDVIRTYVPGRRPLFLAVDYFAPHNGGGARDRRCRKAPVPDPDDIELFEDERLPRPRSFNERDVSDKPRFMRQQPRISRGERRRLTRRYGCTLASLRAVDRGVEAIYEELEELGELERTVLVFWSDNGYFNGEHRVADKKQLPYEEGLRVPIAMRVGSEIPGGGDSRRRVREPVANIDLGPTILDFAGGRPCIGGGRCRVMDGRSLRDLVRGDRAAFPGNRKLAIEWRTPGERSNYSCAYEGVRADGAIYVEHTRAPHPRTRRCQPGNEAELYDLDRDPLQLRNRAEAPRTTRPGRIQAGLERSLRRLRDCRGIRGRDPRPGGGRRYCD